MLHTPTLWGVGTRAAFSWAGTAPSLQANIQGIIVNRIKGPEPTKFKVPSLRVVSCTAPYFHDGRFATLVQAV